MSDLKKLIAAIEKIFAQHVRKAKTHQEIVDACDEAKLAFVHKFPAPITTQQEVSQDNLD